MTNGFINGFVTKCAAFGLNEKQAAHLLSKLANMTPAQFNPIVKTPASFKPHGAGDFLSKSPMSSVNLPKMTTGGGYSLPGMAGT